MLALPPESAIASLAVGLDPLSRERFNQSISKMEGRMQQGNQSWIEDSRDPFESVYIIIYSNYSNISLAFHPSVNLVRISSLLCRRSFLGEAVKLAKTSNGGNGSAGSIACRMDLPVCL